jgi:DNA-binding NarL/FixJ family response regulator
VTARSGVVRAGLEAVLANDADIIVAGSASELSVALLDNSDARTVDVLVANIENETDFDDLLTFANEVHPEDENSSAIVALLAPQIQTNQRLVRALQNNLQGILPHDARADEVISAVKAVAVDLIVLSPDFGEMILNFSATATAQNLLAPGENQTSEESVENLTRRELEVLELLAEGASNKTIADRLNISEHTVKFHVASVFGKLGANSRTEAVTQALRNGLILL